MLYATQLAEGVLLAMVFETETPFSTIRSQAGQLVTSLAEDDTKAVKPELKKPELSIATGIIDDDDDGEEMPVPPISEIIVDVPSPDPQRPQPQKSSPPDARRLYQPEVIVDPSQTRRSIFSRESSIPIPLKELLVARTSAELDQTVASQSQAGDELDVTAPSRLHPQQPPAPAQQGVDVEQSHPSSVEEGSERIVLEPVSAGVYNLTYACLLVPRFSAHYLTGDIADHLSECLPNICVAFGWRLEYMAVRPEYLQWVVNVPPATSPGYLMRIMRQQTSEKVFVEFPSLKKENPSGDFWAPGYLIMGSTKPHPPQLVKDYIKQIRQRQGIEKKRK
jgi:REP element-mobilizing transposase RayT